MFRIRLKELREKAGYSQYTFADKFGVSQSAVGRWEAGKREPKFDTMSRLADFFGVSIDYLMGREDTKKAPAEAEATKKDDELSKKLNTLLSLANEDTKKALVAFLEQTLKDR